MRYRLLTTAIALAASTPAFATPMIGQLYNFGDSLVDDGKTFGVAPFTANPAVAPYSFPVSPPYSSGRHSNGRMWTEQLAERLGAPQQVDQNFAFGGATSRLIDDPASLLQTLGNFSGQIDLFARAFGGFGPNDLVTVTFGGNDVPLVVRDAARGRAPLAHGLQRSVDAVVGGLERLSALGATRFLVSDVPRVSFVPFIAADPAGFERDFGATVAAADAAGANYNRLLEAALADFALRAGADVQLLALDGLFSRIFADQAAFGFENLDEECLLTRSTARVPRFNSAIDCRDPAVAEATLFWDQNFHPTAAGQAVIAAEAFASLNRVPGPGGPWLMLAALGMLGAVLWRRADGGAAMLPAR